MAKTIYIVLTHTWVPSKKETQEVAEFVDSLRNRDYNTATTIIDFTNERIVKDRNGKSDYKQFIWDLVKKYPVQMNELIAEYKTVKGNAT